MQGIIVMAATNLADILDPALTRPGRFDRHVSIQLRIALVSVQASYWKMKKWFYLLSMKIVLFWICQKEYNKLMTEGEFRLWSLVRMCVDAKRFWNSTSKANLCQMMWMLKQLLVELLDSMVLVSILKSVTTFCHWAMEVQWFTKSIFLDLANLVNIAAIKAAVEGAERLSAEQLEFAKDRIVMGIERKTMFVSEDSKKVFLILVFWM